MSALRRVQITGRAALLIAAALFVAVTAIRFAFADPTNGVGFFYVVPIALVAAERGWRAGVAVAVAATAVVYGWAELTHAPVSDVGNLSRLVTLAAIGWLVGVLVKQRDEMAAESARWFSMSNGLLCVVDLEGNFSRVNPALTEKLGYSQQELLSRPFISLVHPDDVARTQEIAAALVAEPSEVVGFENRFRSAGGDWLWLSWTSRSDGHRIYAVAKDITERKRADELRDARLVQAEAEAHADDLTGLLNRRAWDLELTRHFVHSSRRGRPLSVAMLDLDGLKEINDTRGHRAGSAAIKHAAASWASALRESDLIARVGGDEFAVLMPGSTLEQAASVAERLRSALHGALTTSVGVAQWDGDEPVDELLERADAALYEAKRSGRNRVAIAGAAVSDPLSGS